jgi:hypothetical protein
MKRLYSGTKKPTVPGNSSPKESKYPTRNKTRNQDCQESSNNESKRNQLNKKLKEKEALKKPATLPNHMMPMPFQVMPQTSPGAPMVSMFPLVQNAQKYSFIHLGKTPPLHQAKNSNTQQFPSP